MHATYATEPSPGGTNEDLASVGPTWALVLDGAGRYPGHTGGCRHTVTWIVGQLAAHVAARLTQHPEAQLSKILGAAIQATMDDHGPGCDLTDPLSPGATVALVRWRDNANLLEWLVLGDCAVSIEQHTGDLLTVIDDRVDRLPNAPVIDAEVRTYDPAFVATLRNKPGGFWVAGAVPEAASHAYTGQISLAAVNRVLLCSDGVSRLTERYGWSWADVFDVAERSGAPSLIEAVRTAEASDPDPRRWRGKKHDDATAVYVTRSSPATTGTP